MLPVANEEWIEEKRNIAENIVTFRYRAGLVTGSSPSDFPVLVSINWEFCDYDDPFKFQGSVQEHHQDLEQALSAIDDGDYGYLILVKTGEEVKEWLWYVKNFDEWLAKLNELFSGKSAFPIEINFFDEPEWETFEKLKVALCDD